MPWQGTSNEYLQHMYSCRNKKNIYLIPILIWSYVYRPYFLLVFRLNKAYLIFSTLGTIFSTHHFEAVSYFSQTIGMTFHVMSPLETICMKCQNLFSRENKKNISICHLLKILSRVLCFNYLIKALECWAS